MAEMNARYGVDPWFPSFDVIREVGITAQQVTPGHQNLVGGSGVVVKNVGMDVERMVVREPSSLVFSIANDREGVATPAQGTVLLPSRE